MFTEETNYEKDAFLSTKRNVKGGLKTVNELVLVESRTAREQFINKVEILEKVKALPTLPDDLHVTVAMAAEYYEVETNTVKQVIKRHREEFETDGYKVLKGSKLKEFKDFLKGRYAEYLPPEIKTSSQLALLPRRAVLRLGMLLQDSEVAQRVRDYLLDMEGYAIQKLREEIEKLRKENNTKAVELYFAQEKISDQKELIEKLFGKHEYYLGRIKELEAEAEHHKEVAEIYKSIIDEWKEMLEEIKEDDRRKRMRRFIQNEVNMKVLPYFTQEQLEKLSFKFAFEIKKYEEDVEFEEVQEFAFKVLQNLKRKAKK